MKKESLQRALESFEIEQKAIADIPSYLDIPAFEAAVAALSTCGKIMTSASGHSGIAAEKFAHAMCCIERPGFFLPPTKAIHGGMGGLKKGDVMVLVSRGGKTSELLPIIDVCKTKGATLIAVTEKLDSPLAKNADIVLPLKIEKESDKFNMQATASFVATIALFDALMIGVMEETDYQKEMFALIHPGGAVGARLNNKEV